MGISRTMSFRWRDRWAHCVAMPCYPDNLACDGIPYFGYQNFIVNGLDILQGLMFKEIYLNY